MNADDIERHKTAGKAVQFVKENHARIGISLDSEPIQDLFRKLEAADDAIQRREEREREYNRLKAEEEALVEEMFTYLDIIHSVAELKWKEDRDTRWAAFEKPDRNLALNKVMTAAESIAIRARPMADELLRWNVSLDRLDALIKKLEQVYTTKNFQWSQKTAATQTVPVLVARASRAVRRAGKVMKPLMKEDPALRAAWKAAARIGKPQPQRLLYRGPLALPSGETAPSQHQLPATTTDQASVKLIVTKPAKQLTRTETMQLLPSGALKTWQMILSRVSRPLIRLSDLFRGVDGRGAGPSDGPSPRSND